MDRLSSGRGSDGGRVDGWTAELPFPVHRATCPPVYQTPLKAALHLTRPSGRAKLANWVLDIPDLTSAGYDQTWALKSGTPLNWQVFAAGGNVLQLLGATPVNGANIVAAGVASSGTFNRLVPFKLW